MVKGCQKTKKNKNATESIYNVGFGTKKLASSFFLRDGNDGYTEF